jgi:hypothetical protein
MPSSPTARRHDRRRSRSPLRQFYRHAELTRLLFDYADALPGLVQLQSIGKSHEGRDIWLATVTNSVTGVAADKPALLGRRQHPRRRADGQHRLPVLPAPAGHYGTPTTRRCASCSTRAPSTSARA